MIFLHTYFLLLHFSTFISIGIMNLDQTNHIYHNIANTTEYRSVTEGPLSGATCPRFF
jgi:hypothetical protein